jgi:hypothetical protein
LRAEHFELLLCSSSFYADEQFHHLQRLRSGVLLHHLHAVTVPQPQLTSNLQEQAEKYKRIKIDLIYMHTFRLFVVVGGAFDWKSLLRTLPLPLYLALEL